MSNLTSVEKAHSWFLRLPGGAIRGGNLFPAELHELLAGIDCLKTCSTH